jgi:hypothetical protein
MRWRVNFFDSEYNTCITVTASSVIEVDFHTVRADGVLVDLGAKCQIQGIETGTSI